MSRTRYKIYDSNYPYFLTLKIIYELPLFSIASVVDTILESMLFMQKERTVDIFAFVVMENHLHLIAQSDSLQQHISSFKSFTARQIIDYLKTNGHRNWLRKLKEQKAAYKKDSKYQFWQEGYHPKQIIGDKMMIQKIRYIHHNPVKRGYVDQAEDWRYSSARNYSRDTKGLIPIKLFKGRAG